MRMHRSGKSTVRTECFNGTVKSFKVVLKAGTHIDVRAYCVYHPDTRYPAIFGQSKYTVLEKKTTLEHLHRPAFT
jgi:hypothetical protein